jgi:hypothetical protein
MVSGDRMPQFSTRALFLATLLVALEVAAFSSRHWFFSPAFLIAACVLISLLLVTQGGVPIPTASKIGSFLLLAQCVLYGGMLSVYLLAFDKDIAMKSFGLGSPFSAGILAGLFNLPYAILCFGLSCVTGFVIKRFMERRTIINSKNNPINPNGGLDDY